MQQFFKCCNFENILPQGPPPEPRAGPDTNKVLTYLNNIDSNIKFKLENEIDKKLNFLDITITRFNSGFETRWFRKKSNIWRLRHGIVANLKCKLQTRQIRYMLFTSVVHKHLPQWPKVGPSSSLKGPIGIRPSVLAKSPLYFVMLCRIGA